MRFTEIEGKIDPPIEYLLSYRSLCEKVEIGLPDIKSKQAIEELRALQQALRSLNEELNRMGVLISFSYDLQQAQLNIAFAVEQCNQIIIHLVVLRDMKPISEAALNKRLYIAGLIRTLIGYIEPSLASIKKSVTPTTENHNRTKLSLVIVSEVPPGEGE